MKDNRDAPISLATIERIKERIRVGGSYRILHEVVTVSEYNKQVKKEKVEKVTVDGKYPFVVTTDKGCFTWSEFVIGLKNAGEDIYV